MSEPFLAHLSKSHLLSPDQLQQVTGLGLEPKALAERLVNDGLLTHWQSDQLLAGKHTLSLGKYRLLDKLGEGGMGAVYKALQVSTARLVALKVMSENVVKQPGALSRFHREIRAASALDHSNIVAALDADQVGETHFLVMEYVEGSDLKHWIKQHGRLPIDWATECIRQAALGLQHAHERGLAHRDIKPSNLLVVKGTSAEVPHVKILDMGLARFTSEAQCTVLTQTGQCLGTIDYIAPEQAKDTKGAGIRADIFSLGASLFHMLTGEVPYQGRNPMEKLMARAMRDAPKASSLRAEIPPALDAAIAKMLDRDTNKRYQTPIEVARALGPFCLGGELDLGPGEEPISEPSPAAMEDTAATAPVTIAVAPTPAIRQASLAPRPQQALHQNPAVLAGAAVVMAVLGIGVVYAMTRGGSEPTLAKGGSPKRPELKIEPRKEPERPAPPVFPPPPPPVRTPDDKESKKLEKVHKDLGKKGVPARWTPEMLEGAPDPKILRTIPHPEAILGAAISRDGKLAVTAGFRQPIHLWNLDTGEEIRRFDGPKENVWCVALSPDDRYVVAGSGGDSPMSNNGKDNALRLWSIDKSEPLKRFGETHPAGVVSVAFSPNGRLLASVAGMEIVLWDVESGNKLKTFPHSGSPTKLAFSRDGRMIVAGDGVSKQPNNVWLWDVEAGATIRPFKGHSDLIGTVAWSPTDDLCLSAGRDQTLRIWDPTAGEELWKFGDGLYHGVFTPNGRWVLGGTGTGQLIVYDLATGGELARRSGDGKWITAMAVSGDGRRALTAAQGGSVLVWNLSGERAGGGGGIIGGGAGGGGGEAPTAEPDKAFNDDDRWKKAVDLLEIADPKLDALSGEWTRGERGSLISDNSKWTKLQFPYQPPEEYDFRIRFIRREGTDTVAQVLARGDRAWVWELGGWNNTVHGFGLVAGKTTGKNPTSLKGALSNERTYTSVVEVRKGSIKAYLDGVAISQHSTSFLDLSIDPMWRLKGLQLGIGSGQNETIFLSAEVLEVSGRGKLLREKPKFELKSAPARER